MTAVVAWGALFVATHLAMSHGGLRRAQVNALGLRPFRLLYSIVSIATFVPWSVAFARAHHTGDLLWAPPTGVARLACEWLALWGFAVVGAGILAPSPAGLRVTRIDGPLRGAAPLSRHPIFLGLSWWALAHAILNPWSTDVAYYGTMAVLGWVGCLHQDRRLIAHKPGYDAIVAATPFLPLPDPRIWARLDGRARTGLAAGIVAGCVARVLHPAF